MRQLYRRSRLVRIICWALALAPLWQILDFLSDNDLRDYSQTGDAILLTSWILFTLGVWWYSEDRDRRRKSDTQARDGADATDGHGG